MAKSWSVLFGVVMFACAASMVAAPLMGYWMPEGLSTHSWDVDRLFYVILAFTSFFFFLTEGLLVWFMWKYTAPAGTEAAAEEAPHEYTPPNMFTKMKKTALRVFNSQHRVEMAWTLVPALILLYIAFAQISAWARIKYESRMPHGERDAAANQVEVVAYQFGWRMRYPSPSRLEEWRKGSWEPTADGKDSPVKRDYLSFPRIKQMDDVEVVNELHTWVGQPILVSLSTRDVLHSFNLPHMRVKQDAVPGKIIPLWFTPTKHNTLRKGSGKDARWEDGIDPETGKHDPRYVFDLACAELCGWGHYRMIGRLYVHKDYEDFRAWLEHKHQEQQRVGAPAK